MNFKSLGLYLIISFYVLVISGCTFAVNLSHQTDSEKKSPLSGIPPKVFSLEIEDHRPSDSPEVIGYAWNGISCATPFTSNKPVTDVLYDALLNEFTQNNHEIYKNKINDCEAIIKVRIFDFFLNCRLKTGEVALISTIKVEVDIIQPPDNVILTKPINTIFQVPFTWNIKSAYENALNDGLKEFIREFSFDSDIHEALRNIR